MPKIARMADDKRTAILVAFVKAFETIALDDALDILDLLIAEIAGDAKKLGQKKRLRTLKDLDKSAPALASAFDGGLGAQPPIQSFLVVPKALLFARSASYPLIHRNQ